MAQTSGQQANPDPFELYTQRIKNDQALPQLHNRSSLAEMLPACQKRLLWMALVFNLVSPRVFINKTIIRDFEERFIQDIYGLVRDTSLTDRQIRPHMRNKDQVMKYLVMTKDQFSIVRGILESAKLSINDKLRFYHEFNEFIEYIEMTIKYWDTSAELMYNQVHTPSQKLSDCRKRLNDIHTYFRDNGYTEIEISSIAVHERVLREEIILDVLAHSPNKVSNFISEKDAVIKHLRRAKIHLNLALDEYDLAGSKKTSNRQKRLSNCFRICEEGLFDALQYWRIYSIG